tara:strand:+ start:376 stop:717 length:342 start_codon:yes stop_codon:yes gene_type:complete
MFYLTVETAKEDTLMDLEYFTQDWIDTQERRISAKLIHLCEAMEVSPLKLSQATGEDIKDVRAYFRYTKPVPAAVVAKTAKMLQVDVDYFYQDSMCMELTANRQVMRLPECVQ